MADSVFTRRETTFNRYNRNNYLPFKRFIDASVSAILLLILSPFLLLIALCIRFDSPGPVFFKQTRIGFNRRNGDRRGHRHSLSSNHSERRSRNDRRLQDLGAKPFTIYKFRTMYQSVDQDLHRKYTQQFIKNQIPPALDATKKDGNKPRLFKITRDPRVTRVGRILRRFSIDELSQLINVFKGEMSLVGPRPVVLYEVESYQEWHKARLAPLPGITGWWQVAGRNLVTFDEMARMDIYYAEHCSLALDVKILFLTPWAVLSGKGAK